MQTFITITVMILWITSFAVAIIPKIKLDSEEIKAGENINHSKEIIPVMVKLIPLAAVLCRFSGLPWFLSIPLIAVMFIFHYNFLFDGLLNRARGLNFFHVSKPNYVGKAGTERFFSQLPEWGVIAIKVFGTASTTIIYFVTSNFNL